jgi:hypothetical protein
VAPAPRKEFEDFSPSSFAEEFLQVPRTVALSSMLRAQAQISIYLISSSIVLLALPFKLLESSSFIFCIFTQIFGVTAIHLLGVETKEKI